MGESNASNLRFMHITDAEFWAKGGGKHGKFRNWPKVLPKMHISNRHGEFLARLWSLYGTPDDISYEGFHYSLIDAKTGIVFQAYSAGSGPAFGAASAPDEDLEEIANALETLLSQTPLADCTIEFPTDFGVYRVGARNGVAFEESVDSG